MDDLVLFEQLVNSVNGMTILLQLIHLLIPSYTEELLGNIAFCSIWSFFVALCMFHRAIGGLGIAAVRQVSNVHDLILLI